MRFLLGILKDRFKVKGVRCVSILPMVSESFNYEIVLLGWGGGTTIHEP